MDTKDTNLVKSLFPTPVLTPLYLCKFVSIRGY
jgi:hypothetical protein